MCKKMFDSPLFRIFSLFKSISYLFLMLVVFGLSFSASAGGSIFGEDRHKTENINGVYAIGIHICSSLECPPVRIISGKCDGEHMEKRWGVCICDEGYVSENGVCKACPEGEYSDGIHGCTGCEAGTYKENDADTSCKPCPEESYCVAGKAYSCPKYAQCSATDFTCNPGFTKTTTGCECSGSKHIDESGICRTCPMGEFYTKDGVCRDCSDNTYYKSSTFECSMCDNTDTPRKMFSEYCGLVNCPEGTVHGKQNCVSCSANPYPIYPLSREECAKCTDEGTPHWWAADGACNTCFGYASYRFSYKADTEGCAMCNNSSAPRKIFEHKGINYCGPINCPVNYFHTKDGGCYACSSTTKYEATAEDCAICYGEINTSFGRGPRYWDGEYCNLCTVKNATSCDSDGKATGCVEGYYVTDGICVICSDENATACDNDSKATRCKKGYYLNDGACVLCSDESAPECAGCYDDQFPSSTGECKACSLNSTIEATEKGCAMCDDTNTPRKIFEYDGKNYCVLKECPLGNFWGIGYTGPGCYSCSYYTDAKSTAEECNKCSNTDNPRWLDIYGNCTPCSSISSHEATFEQCSKCIGSNYPRFLGSAAGRQCKLCSEQRQMSSTPEECAMCDGSDTPRKIFEYNDNTYCGLKDCGEGRFQTSNGNCSVCSTRTSSIASAEECAKCNNRKTFEYNDKIYCGLKECSDGQYQGTNGSCYFCSVSVKYRSTELECTKCSKRYWDGEYCAPCTKNATKCDSDGKATECKDGYTVQDGECV